MCIRIGFGIRHAAAFGLNFNKLVSAQKVPDTALVRPTRLLRVSVCGNDRYGATP